ncbi:MAG: hypothetical protein M3328_12310 [Chloroflexota bacterium]|nr:hypothetical protein [Chloroflexota bacterium]
MSQDLVSNIVNRIKGTYACGPMCGKLGCYPIHFCDDFAYLTLGKPWPACRNEAGYKLPIAGDFNYLALLNFMQDFVDIVLQFCYS